MAQLVTHQFCVIGKAAVADLLLPPPSPAPKFMNSSGGGCTEEKAAACYQKSLPWFLLFQHRLFFFLIIIIFIYAQFDAEAGFSFFGSSVFFSYHHPNSKPFHTVVWEAQERGRGVAPVGRVRCVPRRWRWMLLSDLFASLGKLLP